MELTKRVFAATVLATVLFLCPAAFADQVAYKYDELGRLTEMTQTDGYTLTQLSYNYDHVGNLTTNSTVKGIHDTDGDDLPDGWEEEYGLNPNDPNDSGLDSDNDGLTNLQEYQAGTNPTLVDSDGDGFSDDVEIASGTDPLDPSSFPDNVPEPVPAASSTVLLVTALLLALFVFRSSRRKADRYVISILFCCALSLAAGKGFAAPAGPGWINVQGT